MSTHVRTVLCLIPVLLLAAACAKKPVQQPVASSETAAPAAARAAQEAAPQETAPVAVESIERVFFDFDSYVLTPAARATLEKNARLFGAEPNRTIVIEGHCDERGSDEYNLALGEKRAQAVKNYLAALGIPARNMNVVSYGEERPLDPASTEEAWAKNRRAEFR